MKKKLILITILIGAGILLNNTYAQQSNIAKLYEKSSYDEIITQISETKNYSPTDCYYIAMALYSKNKLQKAHTWFKKAEQKGVSTIDLYHNHGRVLARLQFYPEAIDEYNNALFLDSTNQEIVIEKAYAYYHLNQLEAAKKYYTAAKNMEGELLEPYYMIPHLYQYAGKNEIALEEFYKSKKELQIKYSNTKVYVDILKTIAELEVEIFNNPEASIKAYKEIISIAPNDYKTIQQLIITYNRAERYSKADSIIAYMSIEAENGNLPTELEAGFIIDKFSVNGRVIEIYEYLNPIQKEGESRHKAFVLTANQTRVLEQIQSVYVDGYHYTIERLTKANKLEYDVELPVGYHYTDFKTHVKQIFAGKLRSIPTKPVNNKKEEN